MFAVIFTVAFYREAVLVDHKRQVAVCVLAAFLHAFVDIVHFSSVFEYSRMKTVLQDHIMVHPTLDAAAWTMGTGFYYAVSW